MRCFIQRLKALPLAKEAMFHVEHTPVQILPPGAGAPGQQVEAFRGNHLQQEIARQVPPLCERPCQQRLSVPRLHRLR